MEAKTYTVTDIQNLLGISRTKAYYYIKTVYVNKGPFRVLKIGDSYRIPKENFDKWLAGE